MPSWSNLRWVILNRYQMPVTLWMGSKCKHQGWLTTFKMEISSSRILRSHKLTTWITLSKACKAIGMRQASSSTSPTLDLISRTTWNSNTSKTERLRCSSNQFKNSHKRVVIYNFNRWIQIYKLLGLKSRVNVIRKATFLDQWVNSWPLLKVCKPISTRLKLSRLNLLT